MEMDQNNDDTQQQQQQQSQNHDFAVPPKAKVERAVLSLSGNGTNQNQNQNQKQTKKKMEPMEITSHDEYDDDNDEANDMESLLPAASGGPSGTATATSASTTTSAIANNTTTSNEESWFSFLLTYWNDLTGMNMAPPQQVGNMYILFPEYFHSSGWGVLGPHWFGPASVWLLLVVATHFLLRTAHNLGPGSVGVCYVFFGISTYLLMDVSFRDPGICRHKEIPEDIITEQLSGGAGAVAASQWRWCDFCNVYQPPDGAHCPDCNVCVAGYDHHCVWMGTCIGRRNYRQFIRFNMSWLYYLGFAFFWLLTFGPLFKNTL